MKTLCIENARDKFLHIEAQGCIINIRQGLETAGGQKMITINILADDEAGKEYHIPDAGQGRSMMICVVEGKGK